MTNIVGGKSASVTNIVHELIDAGFPISQLSACPITAIEGVATSIEKTYRGVCALACVGCSAGSIHPSNAEDSINLLTPNLLESVLKIAEEFIRLGFPILSTDRINLFSGSNELDHPQFITLRETLSNFYKRNYHFELGGLSSDLVFHISPSNTFRNNLLDGLRKPRLWDNICLAIDEQLPIHSRNEYDTYLENLSWVWKVLIPALTGNLDHVHSERRGEPRVIINLLIPGEFRKFSESFSFIYPGGPRRALSYRTLVDRYIKPFVGDLEETEEAVPQKHVFTTALGRLTKVPRSSVFISKAQYELIGRATTLITDSSQKNMTRSPAPSIRTKIFPTNWNCFSVQACQTTTSLSEGELRWAFEFQPSWIQVMNNIIVDVSSIMRTVGDRDAFSLSTYHVN